MYRDYDPCSMAESRVDLPQPVSPMTRIPRWMFKHSILLMPMLRMRYKLVKFLSIFLTKSLSRFTSSSSVYVGGTGASYISTNYSSLAIWLINSAFFSSVIGSFASDVFKNCLSVYSFYVLPQSALQNACPIVYVCVWFVFEKCLKLNYKRD